MIYLCDSKRHLVCFPYSVPNLHAMAEDLGIDKVWFHRNSRWPHYDIPKRRIVEIRGKVFHIRSTKDLVRIISGRFRFQIIHAAKMDGCSYTLETWTAKLLEEMHGPRPKIPVVWMGGDPESHEPFKGLLVRMLTGLEAYGALDFDFVAP